MNRRSALVLIPALLCSTLLMTGCEEPSERTICTKSTTTTEYVPKSSIDMNGNVTTNFVWKEETKCLESYRETKNSDNMWQRAE